MTGGSGYIGTAVCDELKRLNLAHNIITRKPFASNCIQFDLLNGETSELSDIVNEHSHIIHCAWFVDRDRYLNSTENFNWVASSMRLASVADNRQVKHFSGIGTCLEYKPSQLPKQITSQLGAVNNYAAAKIAACTGIKQIFNKKDIKFSWSRIFHVFGNKEHPKKLMPTIDRCIKNRVPYEFTASNQIIDLTHISNIAKDLANITINEKQGMFNLCSGVPKTIREIVIDTAGKTFADQFFKFSGEEEMRNNLAGERFV